MQGKDQSIRGMWEYFSLQRAKAKKFLRDVELEKQEGQRKSRANEFLEQENISAGHRPHSIKGWNTDIFRSQTEIGKNPNTSSRLK